MSEDVTAERKVEIYEALLKGKKVFPTSRKDGKPGVTFTKLSIESTDWPGLPWHAFEYYIEGEQIPSEKSVLQKHGKYILALLEGDYCHCPPCASLQKEIADELREEIKNAL